MKKSCWSAIGWNDVLGACARACKVIHRTSEDWIAQRGYIRSPNPYRSGRVRPVLGHSWASLARGRQLGMLTIDPVSTKKPGNANDHQKPLEIKQKEFSHIKTWWKSRMFCSPSSRRFVPHVLPQWRAQPVFAPRDGIFCPCLCRRTRRCYGASITDYTSVHLLRSYSWIFKLALPSYSDWGSSITAAQVGVFESNEGSKPELDHPHSAPVQSNPIRNSADRWNFKFVLLSYYTDWRSSITTA